MSKPREPERMVPDPDEPGGELVLATDEQLVREMVMILSAFKRFSRRQIADTLKIAPETVDVIRSDPEAHDTIVTLGGLLPRPGDIQDLLMSDAERNIVWLRNLRDGKVDDHNIGADDKTLRVRQRAAEVLLDRQVAKRVEIAPAPLRTIDITELQYTRMRKLLEAPPAEIEALPAPDEATRGARTDADFDRGA